MSASPDTKAIADFVEKQWESTIIPTLIEYVKIPNQSPSYDPEWNTNGLLLKVANMFVNWVHEQKVPDLKVELVQLPERTPLIFIEIPTNANSSETVLMYGHLDKQPPLTEAWEAGLGPYTPVIRNGRLYGRGGADDGYALFAALTSVKALKAQGLPHARIVIMIEACEESGSPDLPFYVDHLAPKIGTPSLIVCLDSGCGNYDQFWLTTSLRGLVVVEVNVTILKEGVHSGSASGVVPSSFRIFRQLVSRLEDEKTGQILPKDFYADIPQARVEQTRSCAEALGDAVWKEFPFVDGAHPVLTDRTELLLNRCWRPQLSVTGVDGFPKLESAGNVLRTHSTFTLSLRLPPTVEPHKAAEALKALVEKDPPYGAKVTATIKKASCGWESPALAKWLEDSVHSASKSYYQKPANFLGEGGSIPFMGMLGQRFPKTQFAITGVLGPASNAHGPNEFLDIQFGKNITSCVANILFDHYKHFSK